MQSEVNINRKGQEDGPQKEYKWGGWKPATKNSPNNRDMGKPKPKQQNKIQRRTPIQETSDYNKTKTQLKIDPT